MAESDSSEPNEDSSELAEAASTEQSEGIFLRLFTDEGFVQQLEEDPAAALASMGIDLDDEQLEYLAASREETAAREAASPAVLPAVAVAVRVATSPTVRVGVASTVEVRVATATRTVSKRDQERTDIPDRAEGTESPE